MLKHLLMETNVEGSGNGGGDASVGAGAAAPVLEKGRAEIPDFGELATSSDDLIVADDNDGADTSGSGASSAAVKASDSVAPPAAAVVPPPVAAATPPQPPASATPPVAPATPPAAPVKETPPAAAPAPAVSQEQPLTIEQQREKAIPELAKLYQLTSEEAEALRVTPETALPQLAAKLHFEVVMGAYNAVMSQMPEMVQGFMSHQKIVQEANDKFYSRWPNLRNDAHVDLVRGAIKAFKGANPTADMDAVIRGAGALACIQLGIPLEGAAPAAAPIAPAAPVIPPRPAGVGAGGAPIAPARSTGGMSDIEALVAAQIAGDLD